MGPRMVVAAIRWYQRWISPSLGPHCRFYPSCSEYSVAAVEEWGLLRGLALSGWRILRCHPFSRGGWDPMPSREVGVKEVRSPGVVTGFRK
ncbi:MAG: membrane protein insertion efficiency factor YidD [Clostridia bacterium]|nr:MAG: membrane protein insertion efficiency factor YidD [Clostridia bacterium]